MQQVLWQPHVTCYTWIVFSRLTVQAQPAPNCFTAQVMWTRVFPKRSAQVYWHTPSPSWDRETTEIKTYGDSRSHLSQEGALATFSPYHFHQLSNWENTVHYLKPYHTSFQKSFTALKAKQTLLRSYYGILPWLQETSPRINWLKLSFPRAFRVITNSWM